MKKIPIGVCEFCLPIWGPIAIDMAAAAGFDGLQLADGGGADKGYPFRDPFVRNAYLEAADRAGVAFPSMHLFALFHNRLMDYAPDTAKGAEAEESIRLGVEACSQMGIPAVMITVTNVVCQEQYENVCTYLARAAELCADSGVQLTMETDLPPQQFQRLRERVGDGLKLCFDTMNPLVYGMGAPHELIRQYGLDTIDHCHAKDCRRNARGYFTKYTTPYCLIGQGESGFAESAGILLADHFTGWIISETFYFDGIFAGQPCVELATRDAAYLNRIFNI